MRSPRHSRRSSTALTAIPGGTGRAAAARGRQARLEPAPLPAAAFHVRPGALPASPPAEGSWTDELIRDPAGLRAPRHPRMDIRARACWCGGTPSSPSAASTRTSSCTARTRISAAGCGTPATRCASSPQPRSVTSVAPRRAQERRAQSPRAAGCCTPASTWTPLAARVEALGVALYEATHAVAALRTPRRAAWTRPGAAREPRARSCARRASERLAARPVERSCQSDVARGRVVRTRGVTIAHRSWGLARGPPCGPGLYLPPRLFLDPHVAARAALVGPARTARRACGPCAGPPVPDAPRAIAPRCRYAERRCGQPFEPSCCAQAIAAAVTQHARDRHLVRTGLGKAALTPAGVAAAAGPPRRT